MWSFLTVIGKIAFSLLGWFLGNKAERKARAKEIAKQLSSIEKDGDSLLVQIREEMSKHSNEEWDDIPIRGDDGDSGDNSA